MKKLEEKTGKPVVKTDSLEYTDGVLSGGNVNLSAENYEQIFASTSRSGKVDPLETIELVNAAKGNRSIRAFADAMGSSPSTVSRILTGKTEAISTDLLSRIVEFAAEDSGVTPEKLMKAQGLVKNPKRDDNIANLVRTFRKTVADCLLENGNVVRYMNGNYSDFGRIGDFAIVTDAIADSESVWVIECKSFRKSGIHIGKLIFDKWLERVMNYYYMGGNAGRISFMLDDIDFFKEAKKRLSELRVPDEISVILVLANGNLVAEEYVAPLSDGRLPKLVLGLGIEGENG